MLSRIARPPRTPALAASMVVLGAVAVQWSAALVDPVFAAIGPAATSSWRFLVGAVVLLLVTRPRVRGFTRRQWIAVLALGLSTAVMNQTFFQAIDRINLGTAVAIEYMGPFFVAALGKRSWRHFAWVLLALGGVLLLARPSGTVSWTGLFFAGCAAAGWAAYAYASHFAGDATSGFDGLAVAMAIAALVTFPLFPHSVAALVDSGLVPRMVLASLLAVVIGFGAEMQALRGLPPSIVSVLLAGNPAVAFAVGYIVLGQPITTADGVGTLCVAAAAAQAPTKTTNDGVYTAAQADRGKAVFESKCTTCHESSRFTGDAFFDAFNNKPMKDIWDKIGRAHV